MVNLKSIKWGYGVVISLILGLSGCYMDGQNPQNAEYSSKRLARTNNAGAVADNAKVTDTNKKHYASKEVVQKTTPGPKQTAAPQLPVIQ